jgi:hypothetical protein
MSNMLIPEYCVKCRRAIEVISPTWYRIDWDYTNLRASWHHQPDDTALCVACCLDAASDTERPEWIAKLGELQARKAATGLPGNVTMFHHRSHNTHVYGRVHGVFQFDHYFVHYRGALPGDCALPTAHLAQAGRAPFLTLLHVAFDVSLEGVPALARFTWDVNDVRREGTLQVEGWSQTTHPDTMRLMEGARIFYEQATIGRPRGATVHTYGDYAQAFQIVTAALGRPPKSLEEFVNLTDLKADTIKRNFRRWGIKWSAFRREQSAA